MTRDTRLYARDEEIAGGGILPDDDLVKARESIRSERGAPGGAERQRWSGVARFKDSFLLICTVVTSTVAVGGLLFTIYQFDKTMKAQRHATAEAAVGQFIAQVTELSTQENLVRENASSVAGGPDQSSSMPANKDLISSAGRTESSASYYSPLDSFIVSRAQMLIDGEETGRFAGDILRFLAANHYGHYIGRKPFSSGPRVSLRGSVLVNSKLSQANVMGIFLNCMGFELGEFEDVRFINSSFSNLVLNQSRLMSVDFSDSWLASINFSDTEFVGSMVFDNATLYGVNFSRSRFRVPESISFKGANIIHSDLSRIEYMEGDDANEFYKHLAKTLSDADSLWETELGEPLNNALVTLLGEDGRDELVKKPVEKFKNAKEPELDWAWDDYCPPQQLRDRRFNVFPGDSLSVVQALF